MSYTTSLYNKSSSDDVKVAGNFNNWQPEELTFDPVAKVHVYTIKEQEKTAGKYTFKFIVDGVWATDQDYPSEFDESGNENNVVFFDHTDNQSADRELQSQTNSKVAREIALEPSTPATTPKGLSAQTTLSQFEPTPLPNIVPLSTPSTSEQSATKTAAPKEPQVTSKPDPNGSTSANAADYTTASKNIEPSPKTATQESAKSFIPLTETAHGSPKPDNKPTSSFPFPAEQATSSAPKPEPVGRPSAPTETATGSSSKSTAATVPDPTPVDRPEVELLNGDDVDNDNIADEDEDENYTDSQEQRPDRSFNTEEGNRVVKPADDGKYGIGFFAAVLHIITQFFRGWWH